jgi:acyl-CoA synthetase (AMP-forming)/AMP-acid ligase II
VKAATWHDESGRRFIRTGDVGRLDADGYLWLCDRKKDLIISGGYDIYPADIERMLQRHPAVREVAVVGFPSTRWGETPMACWRPRPAG